MTALLMFVIMAVATDTRAVGEAAAIAVGGTIGLCALFGGPISGASLNPARSLGPALVSGELNALWLYIVAPGRWARSSVRLGTGLSAEGRRRRLRIVAGRRLASHERCKRDEPGMHSVQLADVIRERFLGPC